MGDGRQARQFSPSANTGAPAGARRIRNVRFARWLNADNRGGRLTGVIHVYQRNTSPNQAWEFKGACARQEPDVWVAYLCDVRMVAVPAIPYYDDMPVRLIKPSLDDVNAHEDPFIVQNQRVRSPFVTQWITETGRPGLRCLQPREHDGIWDTRSADGVARG
ncbi:hypothetical protein [Nonomuraea insulae]|uniref:Uncharacterized protein n=1 Tax=Nonomuraea insulae TaxID=1616787 RepID=A0ABW1D676_9ACTN